MFNLLLVGIITSNPTIYVVVEKSQPKSQFAVNDFQRDYSAINPQTNLTPRQLNTHHAKVRRLNKIRDSIRQSVVFLNSDDCEYLKTYPQYRVGKYGKWHPFPKQAFYANGWLMLTVARIIDSYDYEDRIKAEETERSRVFYNAYQLWKQQLDDYFNDKVIISDSCDLPAVEALQKIRWAYIECQYEYSTDGLNWYYNCCSSKVDNPLTSIYYDYRHAYPDMPYMLIFCPAITPPSYLPFDFDVVLHEGFKRQTKEIEPLED